jgi:hypothetical protein
MATPTTKTAPKATTKRVTGKAGSTAPKRAPKSEQQQAGGTTALEKSRAHITGQPAAGGKPAGAAPEVKAPADSLNAGGAAIENKVAGEGAIATDQIITEADGTMRGGTKRVKIEVMEVLSRGGLNTRREEEYPFTALPMSEVIDGKPKGPSFFIPKSDAPDQKVATARKRYRGKDVQFVTRKHEEVVEGEEKKGKQPGLRVWKVPGGTLR